MQRSATFALLLALVAGCGARQTVIAGTQVPDTTDNRDVIGVVENYRLAVERGDAGALMLMAHPDYWEDAGTTASGADDYGYDGLKQVLATRFKDAQSIRYSLKYMGIKRHADKVWVDVLVHASFEVRDGRGELVRRDMRDQNQLVLQRDGKEWKFLSGM
jgi:hypothetical protein